MPARSRLIPPDLLLQAYAEGYFPMAESADGPIEWFTADPRAVLPLHPFHVPRRLRRSLARAPFRYTRDRDFERVVHACGDRADTWISREIAGSYLGLHRLGHAHSIEVWEDDRLVGGLYGVHLGAAFFGESLFGKVEHAAKAALVHLAAHLEERGFQLLEIQMVTPLTAQFAPRLVRRPEYRRMLKQALSREVRWEEPQGRK